MYLTNARREIDAEFGNGYAVKNPQLVATFMEIACSDSNCSMQLKTLEQVCHDFGAIAQYVVETPQARGGRN
jgi:hypothetical protein